jgi:hypothetical protein
MKVRIATVLMWLIWVAGTVYFLGAWAVAKRTGYPALALLASIHVIVLTLLALLIRAVMSGRNWARIMYAALAVFAIASIVLSWISANPVMKVVGGTLVIAYSIILTLLFHSASQSWFSRSARAS